MVVYTLLFLIQLYCYYAYTDSVAKLISHVEILSFVRYKCKLQYQLVCIFAFLCCEFSNSDLLLKNFLYFFVVVLALANIFQVLFGVRLRLVNDDVRTGDSCKNGKVNAEIKGKGKVIF